MPVMSLMRQVQLLFWATPADAYQRDSEAPIQLAWLGRLQVSFWLDDTGADAHSQGALVMTSSETTTIASIYYVII